MTFGKISIIMAAYNADSFIEEAIYSVIEQSYLDWELIVINDGSTDQTEKKILLFEDQRILYFKVTNAGVSAARNFGLRKMTGKYYTFFDADDILPDNSLLSRVRIFQDRESTCFVDGNVEVCNQNFQKLLYTWRPKRNGPILKDLVNLSGDCFFGPTWLIRRHQTPIIFFDESLTHGEDLLQFIQLAAQGGEYQFTDDVILRYRRHKDSAMANLKGLKDGYFKIYSILAKKGIISGVGQKAFRRKMLSILLKSYIRRFELRGFLKVISDYYRLTIH